MKPIRAKNILHPAVNSLNHRLAACGVALSVLFGLSTAAIAQAGDFRIIESTTEAGVTEARFDIEVNGQTVPGLLWTPEGAEGTRPLVLFGHGGTQHKRVSNILRSARDLVVTEHYAVAAIDAPRHGERDPDAPRGESNHTAEWMATVDALQGLDYVGEGPIGYWGVSMGTSFGVPFVAADQRVDVAIFGLFGLFPGENGEPTAFEQAARSIDDIPLMFVFQWNDRLMTPQQGLDLYDAFGSQDKVMHINPGGHTAIPVAERESWKPFFVQHLGKAHVRQ